MSAAAQIAVLFARSDSCYKDIQDCDVWDVQRDARKWGGGLSVVAHPPCRAWGRLRRQANPRPDEKDLALLAVKLVRRWGGVLEHPWASTLWPAAGLPLPGAVDEFGGFTLPITQYWWGHEADKRTWLYICGLNGRELPDLPLKLGRAPKVVGTSLKPGVEGHRPSISHADRERTPPDLALWLVEVARRCK